MRVTDRRLLVTLINNSKIIKSDQLENGHAKACSSPIDGYVCLISASLNLNSHFGHSFNNIASARYK